MELCKHSVWRHPLVYGRKTMHCSGNMTCDCNLVGMLTLKHCDAGKNVVSHWEGNMSLSLAPMLWSFLLIQMSREKISTSWRDINSCSPLNGKQLTVCTSAAHASSWHRSRLCQNGSAYDCDFVAFKHQIWTNYTKNELAVWFESIFYFIPVNIASDTSLLGVPL